MWSLEAWMLAVVGSAIVSSGPAAAADPKYIANSMTGIRALYNTYYSADTGLWSDVWWNSGCMLTTMADFTLMRPEEGQELGLPDRIRNTFVQAQQEAVRTSKEFSSDGMVTTVNCYGSGSSRHRQRRQQDTTCWSNRDLLVQKRRFKDFLNEYYDDEGWWAIALMRVFDTTQDQEYLDAAVIVYEDMLTGLGGPCNGGIYWNKEREFVNAISNELFLTVAASLSRRISDEAKKAEYLKVAEDQWAWFKGIGLINDESLVNDGLTDDCNNNGDATWTYNQGVILGGLTELYRANGDESLLDEARKIADAAISRLITDDGILQEATGCEEDEPDRCGADGGQFKGIFIRNLAYLHQAAPEDRYRDFILLNADTIWEKNRNADDLMGAAWYGPYYDTTGIHHSSALDAIVAAVAVS